MGYKEIINEKGEAKMKKKKTDKEWLERPVIASGMECTGMMPTPPQNESEYDSYRDLYTLEFPDEKKED